MPSTLNRISELYSPWPALRGAASRRESTTAAIADTAKIMSSTRASPSTASAPEMIDAGWFRRVTSMTIEATSAADRDQRHHRRARHPAEQADDQHHQRAHAEDDERHERGPVDMGPLEVGGGEDQRAHGAWATLRALTDAWAICWACAGATAALTVGPERRRPNWG